MNTETIKIQKSNKRIRGAVIALGLMAGMTAFLALAVIGVMMYARSYTLILPGVRYQGMDLGGMTQSQAIQALNARWNENRTMEISDGTRTWTTPLSYFGLSMDVNAMIAKAYAVGRDPVDVKLIYRQLRGNVIELEPVIVYQAQAASDYLKNWGATIDQGAVDASLEYHEGKVTINPAKGGEKLNQEVALQAIQADPAGFFFSGKLKVSFIPIDPQVNDLAGIEQQIQGLQATHLSLTVYDPITDQRISWEINQKTIDSWILVRQEGPSNYSVSLNKASLTEYLQNLDKKIKLEDGLVIEPIQNPQEFGERMLAGEQPIVQVRHKPSDYVAEGGESLLGIAWQTGIPMWRLIEANPGVNQRWIPAGTHLTIPSPNDLLPYPVVLNKRIVISISEQHMWVYQDGDQIKDFVISTGIADSPTQPGIYQVQTHELNAYADNWDLWMPHWLGIYEAWPGFMNGIHGLPMLSNGVRLWKNILGRPASYGCIILDLPQAEWLYGWAENGVVVEIRR